MRDTPAQALEPDPEPARGLNRETLWQLAESFAPRVLQDRPGHGLIRVDPKEVIGIGPVEADDVHAQRQAPVEALHGAALHLAHQRRRDRAEFGDGVPAIPDVALHEEGRRSGQQQEDSGEG